MFMNFFQLLKDVANDCSTDVSYCCSDAGIALFLHVFKSAMDIIHIIVPIVLIVMCSIDLAKMVISPDDQNKAKSKGLINKVIAAVVVFLIPILFDFIISIIPKEILPNSFDIPSCWNAADEIWTEPKNKQ